MPTIKPPHSGYGIDNRRILHIPGLFGDDKPAPDNTAEIALAANQAKMSEEQLAFTKQVYADGAGDRSEASSRARATSDLQMAAAKKQMALSDDYADYNRSTYRPLEQGIVADAMAYDTPARREAAADQAAASAQMSLDNQRTITARNLERSGVRPDSGKVIAMNGAFDLGAAKLQAGASNEARRQVETLGLARRSDAANMGRNLASNQATSAGVALNQGNSAVANGQVPLSVANGGAALMQSGFSGAQAGMSNAASIYGGIADREARAAAADASGMGAFGGMLGNFAGSKGGQELISSGLSALRVMSDRTKKENIKPVDPEEALEAVVKTPVSNWAYKAGVIPGDDGGKKTGPMAQDVQKTMGSKVAPRGKKIDLISMNGITMSAVQGLALRGKETDGAVKELSKKMTKVMAASGIK